MRKGLEPLNVGDLFEPLYNGEEIHEKMFDDELETCSAEGLSAEELDNLVHTLTARRLVEALQRLETASPGMIQCALRFLKDNDVTSLPVPGSAHETLRKKLGDLPFTPKLTGTEDA
jgi:hypothetical protein